MTANSFRILPGPPRGFYLGRDCKQPQCIAEGSDAYHRPQGG